MNHHPVRHAHATQADQTKPRKKRHAPRIGERTDRIEGSFRRITVEQLTLAWWLYQSGHITRRQHRVYMAAHELAEQRRYMKTDKPGRRPLYTVEEFSGLIGGQGSEQAIRELKADMRRLARIGLVTIGDHEIRFADTTDQITLQTNGAGEEQDGLSGFRSMLEDMPNNRRSVPVPRRLLRAMAAGFSRSVTALVTAVLIRGLYWHRETSDYRTDGRYKLSWVSERFGISRRAATDARNTLIGLGWLEPIEVSQWEMNRWGMHDRIVPEWSHTARVNGNAQPDDATAGAGEGSGQGTVGSATPKPKNKAGSATPDQTGSLPLPGNNLKTRTLRHARSRSGVSRSSTAGRGSVGRRRRTSDKFAPPNIRDIRAWDLSDTTRLLELHRQACKLGLASSSEAGRMEFMALAQRARTRGNRPGAMFAWLLREQKHEFITLSDEDQASRMLREHLRGGRTQWGGSGDPEGRGSDRLASATPDSGDEYTDDERFVLACIRVAKKHRINDPWRIAREKGWTRERWERAYEHYESRQLEQVRLGAQCDWGV